MFVSRILGRSAAVLAGFALVVVVGCGDGSGLATRYPVSGKITYNGQPVEKGRIDFAPEAADGRAASGEITNGTYSLTTATPGDGALPGKYKVTVISVDVNTEKLKEIAKGGQFHHDAEFAKANATAKKLVPSKYQLADTSGLTADVGNKSNTIDFDLKD